MTNETLSPSQTTPETRVKEGLLELEQLLALAETNAQEGAADTRLNDFIIEVTDGRLRKSTVSSGGTMIPGTDEWIPGRAEDHYSYMATDKETQKELEVTINPALGERLEAFIDKYSQPEKVSESANAPEAEAETEATDDENETPVTSEKKSVSSTQTSREAKLARYRQQYDELLGKTGGAQVSKRARIFAEIAYLTNQLNQPKEENVVIKAEPVQQPSATESSTEKKQVEQPEEPADAPVEEPVQQAQEPVASHVEDESPKTKKTAVGKKALDKLKDLPYLSYAALTARPSGLKNDEFLTDDERYRKQRNAWGMVLGVAAVYAATRFGLDTPFHGGGHSSGGHLGPLALEHGGKSHLESAHLAPAPSGGGSHGADALNRHHYVKAAGSSVTLKSGETAWSEAQKALGDHASVHDIDRVKDAMLTQNHISEAQATHLSIGTHLGMPVELIEKLNSEAKH